MPYSKVVDVVERLLDPTQGSTTYHSFCAFVSLYFFVS